MSSNDWEQRKFSELYARSSEKNDGSIGMDKNITVATMQFRNDVRVSTTEYLKTYYTFKLGDIAFEGHQSKEFRYGRFVENDIGNGIVSHIFAVFRPIQEYDLYFWKYAINNETLMQRILARSTKASTMMHDLVTNDFLNETFLVPSVTEQKQIGTLLNNLDHLITLHHRKYMKYADLSVFDWEQRKLVDLVDRVTRKNQDLVSELPLTISAQYGLIDQNEFFDKRVASKDVSGYYLIENGEFAYNKSTSTDAPWGAIKRLDRYKNGVLSTLYIVFGIKENNPVDSDFLVSYYSTNLWHKGIHEIAAEGARNHGLLNIAPADFFETKLMIPQDIEEQKKIGKYFEELERLITLHHRKQNYVLNTLIYAKTTLFITKTS